MFNPLELMSETFGSDFKTQALSFLSGILFYFIFSPFIAYFKVHTQVTS